MIQIHASIVLHKSELPSPNELHKGVHPHTKLLHTSKPTMGGSLGDVVEN